MMTHMMTAFAALAMTAQATPPTPDAPAPKETSIPFISFGNIQDFEADGDRGIWLRNRARDWYYASFNGPCTNLPFAHRIAVDTRFGGNRLDSTGRIYVDGEPCWLASLTKSAPPPKRVKKTGA